ncbi:MAG: SufB/SufD family protein [Verrucomicrobiota bacterium]
MAQNGVVESLYSSFGEDFRHVCSNPQIAHIEVHHNRILGRHLVPGLKVDADETDDGIHADIRVADGVRLEHPIRICFGMLPESGLQRINLKMNIGNSAAAGIVAHCTFPNAREIRHEMEAEITVDEGGEYSYFERHVHGGEGGVKLIPRTKVRVAKGGRFNTEFELIKGRVGNMEIDLEGECDDYAVMEVKARIMGSGDDRIVIREGGILKGESSRGVLTSHIALSDDAYAEVYNTLSATGAHARGHVDCKEIIRGNARARAVPVVDVMNPQAHVTHEAAIGSVDSKQLQTLMSRGLNEEEASDLIIQGLLS